MADLAPWAREEAQRLLDEYARLCLAERLEADAVRDRPATGTDRDRRERELDQPALDRQDAGPGVV